MKEVLRGLLTHHLTPVLVAVSCKGGGGRGRGREGGREGGGGRGGREGGE